MRRPSTIRGLLWAWVRAGRSRPTRVAAAIAAAAALAVLLAAAPLVSCNGCDIKQSWRTGIERYDYVQTLTLKRWGRGHFVYGESQSVRLEMEFRFRVRDRKLDLSDFVEIDPDGHRHPRDWPARSIRYRVDEGEWCFDPPFEERRCYACRLTLGDRLWAGQTDYYACVK